MKLPTMLATAAVLISSAFAQDPLPDDIHWWYKSRPVSGEPNAFALQGRYVYAAGSFEFRDRNNLRGDGFGRFNLDLEDWEGIPGLPSVSGVGWAVHAGDDGMIYFGGNDNLSGVAGASGIGRFDPATETISALIDPSPTLASPGQGGGPTNGRVLAIVKIGDLVYVGGEFTGPGGSPEGEKYIRSFNVTTNRWSAVGDGLVAIEDVPGRVNSLVELPDGSLLAGGDFVGGLARWDGSSWSTYAGGVPDDTGTVRVLKVHPDGTLYVGGGFDRVGSGAGQISVGCVASFANGQWSSMDGGFDTTLEQSNGTNFIANGVFDITFGHGLVYVGGDFDATVGRTNGRFSKVAAWDGRNWQKLGSGVGSSGTQNVNTLIADSRGGLLVGGVFSKGYVLASSGGFKIARWVPNFEFGEDYAPGAAFNQTTIVAPSTSNPGFLSVTIEMRSDIDYLFQSSPDMRTWTDIFDPNERFDRPFRGLAARDGLDIEMTGERKYYRFVTSDPF